MGTRINLSFDFNTAAGYWRCFLSKDIGRMKAYYQYVRELLSVHLPFATDCTAAITCPPNFSCTFRGGFYIYCKDSKFVIEWIEENWDVIKYSFLSIILLCIIYLILSSICKKKTETKAIQKNK